jgi:hypothetical protein
LGLADLAQKADDVGGHTLHITRQSDLHLEISEIVIPYGPDFSLNRLPPFDARNGHLPTEIAIPSQRCHLAALAVDGGFVFDA